MRQTENKLVVMAFTYLGSSGTAEELRLILRQAPFTGMRKLAGGAAVVVTITDRRAGSETSSWIKLPYGLLRLSVSSNMPNDSERAGRAQSCPTGATCAPLSYAIGSQKTRVETRNLK